MASDTFNIDPSVISAVSDNIRIVNESLKESASEAKNFNSNILDAAETMVNMGTNANIIYTNFSDLSTVLKDMTGSLNEVNDVLNDCRVNLGKQLGQVTTLTNSYRQLLIQARSYATQLSSIGRIQQANRQRMGIGGRGGSGGGGIGGGGGGIGGGGVGCIGGGGNNTNNVSTQRQIANLLKQQVNSLTSYAISLTGIQFSLGGIIKALVEAYDKTRKLTGISQIVNAQFKEGGRDVKAIANATYALRSSFKLSIDEAGKYMKQLSRLGLEKDQIQKFSKELVATEILYGQSIDDQVESMQNLINNFGLVSKEALNYNSLIRQTAIEMPNMSMTSVIDEIGELIQNQKMYNTDLLSTIGLYGILMRQDMSKKLGFDTLPRDFRKALVTGISGINKNMSDEWKAALGMFGGAGKTPAAAILGFEKMDDAEKLVTILQFATKKTGGGGLLGATPERIIMIRKLLEDMGIWSKEITQKVVAEMQPGKPLDVDQIAKLISGAQTEQKAQTIRLAIQEKQRNKDIATTAAATSNMQPTADRIAQLIEKNLIDAINRLIGVFTDYYNLYKIVSGHETRLENASISAAMGEMSRYINPDQQVIAGDVKEYAKQTGYSAVKPFLDSMQNIIKEAYPKTKGLSSEEFQKQFGGASGSVTSIAFAIRAIKQAIDEGDYQSKAIEAEMMRIGSELTGKPQQQASALLKLYKNVMLDKKHRENAINIFSGKQGNNVLSNLADASQAAF